MTVAQLAWNKTRKQSDYEGNQDGLSSIECRLHGTSTTYFLQDMSLSSSDQGERTQRKLRAEPEEKTENKTASKYRLNTESDRNWSLMWYPTEGTPENWPEPGPRWNDAYNTWKWAWELHIYLYATVFLAIGLYAGYYIIANIYDGTEGKYLGLSLNIMVTIFGFTRAFVMYFDPYHQGHIIDNTTAMRVIWSLSGPCLTAADCLMILALIETANISIAPPKLQKASVNAAIISFHFALVIITDFVVGAHAKAKVMLLFCQVFFVIWGSILGTGNFAIGYKLDKLLFSHKNPKDRADKIYVYLIYASGAANYFLCGIVLYSAFGVFGVYSDVRYVDAWSWWALQTFSRFSEVVACVLIFTVSAKRTRIKDTIDKVSNPAHHASERNSLESKSETFQERNTERGRKMSLFTALREIALIQAMMELLPSTNLVSPMNTAAEGLTETSTL
ncbi:uncharacterized protein [Montipora capricornis]|uniref:uncharacterized protein isoform X1 n=1 Tax=Montipora capricornis TaxID=246305 RepID=UPI0035F11A13